MRRLLSIVFLTMVANGTALAGNPHVAGNGDCSAMPPGQAKKNPHCGGRAAGGPPPWAPAHGYRKQRDGGYAVEDPDVHVRIGSEIGISNGTCRREALGTIVGGVIGGVVGNRVGDESEKPLTTIAGAVIGALVGKTIGKKMDEQDQHCTGQVLERADDGKSVHWVNDQGMRFDVTPQSTYTNRDGAFCRTYTMAMTGDKAVQKSTQSACRTSTGAWQNINNSR